VNIIEQIEAEHAAKLPGAKMPAFQPGDTVIVNVKVAEGERTRIQAYEGVCIARSGHGLNENFTVRKISSEWAVGRPKPVCGLANRLNRIPLRHTSLTAGRIHTIIQLNSITGPC